MSNIVLNNSPSIPACTKEGKEKVQLIEDFLKEQQQDHLTTWHTLHGGIYTRTIRLSKGQIISTATINKPTTLTINGHILVYVGDSQQVIDGYGVIPASAGRKQIMVALKDTIISMAFATNAETIGEAEEEYTDSVENLSSRREDSTNYITVTGE
jgi:hypothetical protein